MTESSPHLKDFFCPGCNERFLRRADDPFCPRCGMLAATEFLLDSRQPTLLWRSTERPVPGTDENGGEDLHRLIGRRVHIYDCDEFLGRGGMGWVFLATHGELHRPCALKILSPHLVSRDPDYLDRFRNEGRAAASLNHPNIVMAHAIGDYNGLHFLEMEFVAGRSLQHILNEQRLPTIRATALAIGIACGLAEAHRMGLVHRDLKPDNVLLTHRGQPKIGDFGLAKRVAGAGADMSQSLAGTPHFMAPELFQGASASKASDVYALGVVYFQMLTGQLPYARDSMGALMTAVTSDPVPDARRLRPEIPLEMAECLSLMLDKSPANRPPDGIAACHLLEAVQGHLRDLETLLHDALDPEPGVTWKRAGDLYEVHVRLDDGRSQRVMLENEANTLGGQLAIYSTCCPSRPDYYEQALRLNAYIGNGALSIRDINGVPHFVMLNVYPRSTVDAEEIRRTVRDVAAHADSVEQLLTGADNH